MSEEVFVEITVESTNPFGVLKSGDYSVKGMNNSCLISQVWKNNSDSADLFPSFGYRVNKSEYFLARYLTILSAG
jgi:hypothetical protein